MVALVTKISYDRALVCITQVRSLLCQWFLGWVEILFLFLEPIVGWEVETMAHIHKVIFNPCLKTWDCLILLSICLLPCAELRPMSAIPKTIWDGGEPTIVLGCSKYVTISGPNLCKN